MQFFAGGAGGGGTTFNLTFPFGGNLPNAKFVNIYMDVTSTGDVALYTVPAGRRAFIPGINLINNSASTLTYYPEIEISSTFYPLSTSTTLNNALGAARPAIIPYVAEAGEILAINVNHQPVYVWSAIIEFDNTAGLKSPKLTTTSTGNNTLYTVTTGKTAIFGGYGASGAEMLPSSFSQTQAIAFYNNSGNTRTFKVNVVPNGGSVGTTNQIVPAGSASAPTLATASSLTSGAATVGMISMSAGDFVNFNVDTGTSGVMVYCTVEEC